MRLRNDAEDNQNDDGTKTNIHEFGFYYVLGTKSQSEGMLAANNSAAIPTPAGRLSALFGRYCSE